MLFSITSVVQLITLCYSSNLFICNIVHVFLFVLNSLLLCTCHIIGEYTDSRVLHAQKYVDAVR